MVNETLMTFGEAARMPIFQRKGRPARDWAVRRWATDGVLSKAGKLVYLETIKLPSGTFTSREAIDRFIAALNDKPRQPSAMPAEHRELAEPGDGMALRTAA